MGKRKIVAFAACLVPFCTPFQTSPYHTLCLVFENCLPHNFSNFDSTFGYQTRGDTPCFWLSPVLVKMDDSEISKAKNLKTGLTNFEDIAKTFSSYDVFPF